MSRALVTGASGFIGGRLCRRLLTDGDEVHAISRRPREDDALRWWQSDLGDADAVASTLEEIRPDVVYHLAGYVSGSRELEAVLPSLRDNLVSAVNALVAAARVGCSVVLAGSQEEPEPATEDPVPASPYAAAKLAVSSFARMLHALHGLRVVHLRVFMVYGPGQHDRTKLVPYTITSLLNAARPKLSSGARAVDWVYVDDVVDAFVAAASRDDLAGASLDVGTGELVTIRGIVDRIVETVGTAVEPDFGALPDRPLEIVRAANVERTKQLLGWQPRTTLADGLRSTVNWYRAELEREQRSAPGPAGG
jgi:nucleoside-diphosphate-sugar epimerase